MLLSRIAADRHNASVNLRCFTFALLLIGLLAPGPGRCLADEITVSGHVEMTVDRGNGLTRFYIKTPDIKYRIWVHILDPEKNLKETLLETIARKKGEASVTGEVEIKNKEKRLRITKILPH